MTNALVRIDSALPALPIAEIEAAVNYSRNSRAPSTQAEYRKDWRLFEAWCAERNGCALPATPATVATYLAHLAESGLRSATISRRGSAIRYAHKLAGHESPTNNEIVGATLAGIRRTITLPSKRKAPAVAEITIAMANAAAVPGGLKATRDRALILFSFASAMRRSEIVALNIADLEFTDDGIRVTIRRSKTDVEGKGQIIAIPRGTGATCPVRSLRAYLDAAGIVEGPIWRPIRRGGKLQSGRLSAASVNVLVKHYVRLTGRDAAQFGAHSTRAGFIASSAARGASIWNMADQSRHKSLDVLRGYVRNADIFRDHAGAGLL